MGFGCQQASTCIIVLLNVFFLVCSFVIMFVGVATIISPQKITSKTDLLEGLDINTTAYVVLGIGVAMLLVSFIGMYSSIAKHKGLLIIYIVLLTILTAGQLGSSIFLLAFGEKATDFIDKFMEEKWNDSVTTRTQIQDLLDCCGYDNISNPEGVCEYNVSCKTALLEEIEFLLLPFGAGIAGLGVLQLGVLSAVIWLCCKTSSYDDDDGGEYDDF